MASNRAERLGAANLLFGLVHEPRAAALEACLDMPLLTVDEWAAWRETDEQDITLALACLSAEFELRAAQWRCLEFLLHVQTAPDVTAHLDGLAGVPPGGAGQGEGGVATVLIPRSQGIAVAILALGWHLPPPVERC